MKTPMKVSAMAFIVNLTSALLLMGRFGAMGLVGANVISGIFQAALLSALFSKRRKMQNVFFEILKILTASILMGFSLWILKPCLSSLLSGKLSAAANAAILVPFGIAIYAMLLFVFKFREFGEVKKLMRRKD